MRCAPSIWSAPAAAPPGCEPGRAGSRAPATSPRLWAAAPPAPGTGSLFWVSDTGVRYGIDTEPDDSGSGHGKTVEALGLNAPPVPIPWSILSLFASRPDAVAGRRAAGTRRIAA